MLFWYNPALFRERFLSWRYFSPPSPRFAGAALEASALNCVSALQQVTLRNRKETTDASFRGCGMLSPTSGCQHERAPLASSGPNEENRPVLYGCRWAELLVGSFPAKLSEEKEVSAGEKEREEEKGPKPPSRREENGREICEARGKEALRRGVTSAKRCEEKRRGKEGDGSRCASAGSKRTQLGSSSNGRLFIGAYACLPPQPLFKRSAPTR